jgi:hypothetical protein
VSDLYLISYTILATIVKVNNESGPRGPGFERFPYRLMGEATDLFERPYLKKNTTGLRRDPIF